MSIDALIASTEWVSLGPAPVGLYVPAPLLRAEQPDPPSDEYSRWHAELVEYFVKAGLTREEATRIVEHNLEAWRQGAAAVSGSTVGSNHPNRASRRKQLCRPRGPQSRKPASFPLRP